MTSGGPCNTTFGWHATIAPTSAGPEERQHHGSKIAAVRLNLFAVHEKSTHDCSARGECSRTKVPHVTMTIPPLLAPPLWPFLSAGLLCRCGLQGDGIYIDKNSNRYEGQWRNDRAEGYGVKVFAKGDKHEGYYSNDKRNGFGTYFWANG